MVLVTLDLAFTPVSREKNSSAPLEKAKKGTPEEDIMDVQMGDTPVAFNTCLFLVHVFI